MLKHRGICAFSGCTTSKLRASGQSGSFPRPRRGRAPPTGSMAKSEAAGRRRAHTTCRRKRRQRSPCRCPRSSSGASRRSTRLGTLANSTDSRISRCGRDARARTGTCGRSVHHHDRTRARASASTPVSSATVTVQIRWSRHRHEFRGLHRDHPDIAVRRRGGVSRLTWRATLPRGSHSSSRRKSSWSRCMIVIRSNIVAAGGGSTPPTMTSPTSPSAWHPTTEITLSSASFHSPFFCARRPGIGKALRTIRSQVQSRRTPGDHVGHQPRSGRRLRQSQVPVAESVDDPCIRGGRPDRRQRVRKRRTKAHPLAAARDVQAGHEPLRFRKQRRRTCEVGRCVKAGEFPLRRRYARRWRAA